MLPKVGWSVSNVDFCIIWHPCQNVGKKIFFSLFLDCFSIACTWKRRENIENLRDFYIFRTICWNSEQISSKLVSFGPEFQKISKQLRIKLQKCETFDDIWLNFWMRSGGIQRWIPDLQKCVLFSQRRISVNLVKSFQTNTSLYLQNLASIQPRTGLSKFAKNEPHVRKKLEET